MKTEILITNLTLNNDGFGVIPETQETRPMIIRALRALRTKRASRPPKKHGNIPL